MSEAQEPAAMPVEETAVVDTAPPEGPEPETMDSMVRLAEALVFAGSAPVTERALTLLLPNGADVDAVIAELRARYAGRGVELVDVAGGLQFRTAADLAARLKRVVQVPRRLPRVALETLAIVAYHQPVTRPEIEEIRGASLSQATMDALLEAGLITPRGRKETPGRPTMWGTTPAFLAQFGLGDLRDLPRREDLLVDAPQPNFEQQPRPESADIAPAPDPASPEGAEAADP